MNHLVSGIEIIFHEKVCKRKFWLNSAFFVPCPKIQKGGFQPVRMCNKNLKINLLMHQSTVPLII